MTTTSQSLHVRLPRDLIEQLGREAAEQGVSLNALLGMLLAGAVGWSLDESNGGAMSTHGGHHGHLRTVKGRDERNRSSRVIERADGSVNGHLWLPNGDCAAFIIDGERVYVGVRPRRGDAWDEVRRKRGSD
jgi:HicB family